MTYYLEILKCPHGSLAIGLSSDDGGVRITSAPCCKIWDTQERISISGRQLREAAEEFEHAADRLEIEAERLPVREIPEAMRVEER